MTQGKVDASKMFVIEFEREMLGMYSLSDVDKKVAELEFLFVEPKWNGKGVGAMLLEHVETNTIANGCGEIIVCSDPFAAPFYESKGSIFVGEVESSSIKNRMLPKYQILLRLKGSLWIESLFT